jgi:hypothetical protein
VHLQSSVLSLLGGRAGFIIDKIGLPPPIQATSSLLQYHGQCRPGRVCRERRKRIIFSTYGWEIQRRRERGNGKDFPGALPFGGLTQERDAHISL